MNDARIARIAALYRSGSSTEGCPRPPVSAEPYDLVRARQWRAELARSMAELDRRRRQEQERASLIELLPPLPHS